MHDHLHIITGIILFCCGGQKEEVRGRKTPSTALETQLRLSQGTMTQKPEITIEIKTENN